MHSTGQYTVLAPQQPKGHLNRTEPSLLLSVTPAIMNTVFHLSPDTRPYCTSKAAIMFLFKYLTVSLVCCANLTISFPSKHLEKITAD